MTQSHARAAKSIDEVIGRMRAIEARLDPADGVACFNRMYLRVVELTGRQLAAGSFQDRAFTEGLEVFLAHQYVDAVDAADGGRPVNEAWQPLFEARGDRAVRPIQFAFAGMSAHLSHDLPLALVATCIERRTTPDTPPVHADHLRAAELLEQAEAEARASFGAELTAPDARAAESLRHLVGSFSVARALDAAWATTQTLWHERNLRPFHDATLAAVTGGAVLAARLLVTPVLPPVEPPAESPVLPPVEPPADED
ncbi:DUF5995 family protein [Kitasatospora sp. NPDC091207]|uniref:DUF5995 family protein n=1 Tax=Kitasatospora sp. NPDC091207 TaxID=3364083 RepID=UPI0037FC559C